MRAGIFPTKRYRAKKIKLDPIKENTDDMQHTATVENIQRKISTNDFSWRLVSTVNFGCSKTEWDETISRLDNIVVNSPLWPEASSVSWETLPPLTDHLIARLGGLLRNLYSAQITKKSIPD